MELSRMGFDLGQIKQKAKELRAAAERLEAFAKKQEELEKEGAELQRWLSVNQGDPELDESVRPTALSKPEKEILVRSPFPPRKRQLGLTQKGQIVRLLEDRPMTRDDLFKALEPTGKRPPDLNQLSSLLSRYRAEGHVEVENGIWRRVRREPKTD